jgi:hypothetical protein
VVLQDARRRLAMAGFQETLKKLVDDPKFAEEVAKDPARLTREQAQLEAHEMLALMQAWHATGDKEAFASIITLCHCCCGSTPK